MRKIIEVARAGKWLVRARKSLPPGDAEAELSKPSA
jgi:hypothetical protein